MEKRVFEVKNAVCPPHGPRSHDSSLTAARSPAKGQTLVRKLLLWKTNKEEAGDFPGCVACITDFSPNRKTPLERDIRISNSREQIDQLAAAMKAEYIVKGWAPAP